MWACLAEASDTGLEIGLGGAARVWIIIGVAVAVAAVFRRRLPVGVGPGLFTCGLSMALAAAYLGEPGSSLTPLHLTAFFTALAILWHLGARWIEHAETPTGPVNRFLVAGYVGLTGALLAAGSILFAVDAPVADRLGLTLCLVILSALALRRWLDRSSELGGHAFIAAVGGAVYLWALPAVGGLPLGRWRLLAACVALLLALVPVWRHWQFRRHVWRTEPERLTDPPAPAGGVHTLALVLSILVGLGGILLPAGGLTPVAVGLAALATFTVAHRAGGSGLAGRVGLALTAEAVVLAATCWLPATAVNLILGMAVAAGYLLWLARFWRQQLHDGVAWTTTGRLIPDARRLGLALAAGCFVTAAAAAPQVATAAAGSLWVSLVAAVATLLLAYMLVGEATKADSPLIAWLACLLALSVAVPVQSALHAAGVMCPWAALVPYAAVLLAVRVGPQRGDGPREAAYNAFIAGGVPVVVLAALAVPGALPPSWLGPAVLLLGLLLAVGVRRPRWRRVEPAPSS
ncbi:MAG: hypothetical protein PVJ57_02035 [Phycisphaerae bacterium]|jgi:hypothetical protein